MKGLKRTLKRSLEAQARGGAQPKGTPVEDLSQDTTYNRGGTDPVWRLKILGSQSEDYPVERKVPKSYKFRG